VRVDLPAPLSPRMPSVSPQLTSSETPASAVIVPNVFTTFSARIASVVPLIRRLSRGAAAAQSREMDVGDHRDQDRGADHDIEGESVDALQCEPVLQHPEHDAADKPADDRAGAAGDRRTADDAGGDAEKHDVAAAGQWVDRADAKRLQQPGQPAQRAGQHGIADFDAADCNASLGSRDDVAANRNRVQPQRVWRSTTCMNATIASAQMISEYAQTPMIPVSSGPPAVFAG